MARYAIRCTIKTGFRHELSRPSIPEAAAKDLWQGPTARVALMVGSGFSLNAEPLPGAHSRFPLWHELARAIFNALPPRASDTTESREECFNRTSALRIASEYEAQFGRRELELLIREHIPDQEHQPGELHRLLLGLPWSDVFTTNYDTLLERTEVNGRAYQLVTESKELATTFAPRIVKLHGTLPMGAFVTSEEDYRTYPRQFAPLVNCVQQSLIENAFVLIGFSGLDKRHAVLLQIRACLATVQRPGPTRSE